MHKNLDLINLDSTQNDIAKFVNVYFDKESHLQYANNLDKQNQNWRNILVKKSGGLFQWASAACLFLTSNKIGNVSKSWKMLQDNQDGILFELYHSILQQQFDGLNDDDFKNIQLVLGCLILLQKPVSLEAFCQLLPEFQNIINDNIPKLGSIFSSVSDRNLPIYPLHSSCRDFFYTSQTKFCISSIEQQAQHNLVSGCLKIMNQNLVFNICGITTSYKPTQELPDLKTKISKCIPESLKYAVIYWGYHLSGDKTNTKDTNGLDITIYNFLENKLFLWFEALSILNEMAKAPIAIKYLETWKKVIQSNYI